MKKRLILTLALVLALGLAACSGVTGNTPPNTTREPASVDPDFDAAALFERLVGYWNTPDMNGMGDPGLVGFVYEDDRPCVIFGVYDGESTGYVEVIGSQSAGEGQAALTIFFPAQPEDAMYPGPEFTETVRLDLTGLRGGMIRARRESPARSGDWRTYTYAGKTFEEAAAKAFGTN